MKHSVRGRVGRPSPMVGRSGAVFEELERRFATGRSRFDEVISPAELAAEFGISLQPIRAALTQLKTLGYVVIVPQVECRVASPSPKEITDFFHVYGRMEGVIASLAAERHGPLRSCARSKRRRRRINSLQMLRPGLPDRYAALVGEWHDVIRAMSDSPSMARRMKSFWNMSDFILWQRASDLPPESVRRANEQREQIKLAIASRNAGLAERLMYEHLKDRPVRAGITPQQAPGTSETETSSS